MPDFVVVAVVVVVNIPEWQKYAYKNNENSEFW
jgi:hypothetical protein